jgi:hypothetical protein
MAGVQMFRNQVTDKLRPGRFKVTRQIKVGEATYTKAIECNNPAWAYRILDEWEQQLMLQDQPAQQVAA